MKGLIRLALAGLLLTCFSQNLIFAQGDELKNTTPEERAEFLTQWMQSELSLDSAVVPVVYDINLKYSKKNQKIMDSGDQKIQKYKSFKATSEAKDSELKNIFTLEQYNLYQEKKDELRQKMKERYRQKNS